MPPHSRCQGTLAARAGVVAGGRVKTYVQPCNGMVQIHQSRFHKYVCGFGFTTPGFTRVGGAILIHKFAFHFCELCVSPAFCDVSQFTSLLCRVVNSRVLVARVGCWVSGQGRPLVPPGPRRCTHPNSQVLCGADAPPPGFTSGWGAIWIHKNPFPSGECCCRPSRPFPRCQGVRQAP